jgi:putative membrane protein
MTQLATTIGRTARRLTPLTITLLVAATGTAAAHGNGGYSGGGVMGSGGWGLFGGAMGLWGLLWMGLLLAVPLFVVYSLLRRETDEAAGDERPLSVLRERYARGELSDEEFERRRSRLDRS